MFLISRSRASVPAPELAESVVLVGWTGALVVEATSGSDSCFPGQLSCFAKLEEFHTFSGTGDFGVGVAALGEDTGFVST
jgi:hypothetical protein